MKTLKKTVSLLLAILLCASAMVAASAEELGPNIIDANEITFEALHGDVNIDGYLDLKDIVRFKKHDIGEADEFDEEVANYDDIEEINGIDLALLQLDVIATLFG